MKTVKTPTQRWPILAIAEVMSELRICDLNELYGALQGQVAPDVIKQNLDTLVRLGRLKIVDDIATWQD